MHSPIGSKRYELKKLLHLMWPILITQFAQAGLGLIDTIMAGRLSAADLAAIAVGVGVWMPIMLLFSGIMIAATPLVAEAKGAKNDAQIPVIAQQSLWLALILGIAGLCTLQVMPAFLPMMGVPASLIPKASLFLHAIAFGMPAVTLYAALRSYSEALGYPRPVTMISLLALVAIVPLNTVFMYGVGPIPALGSAGCGFATAIVQWLMFISLAVYIRHAAQYQAVQVFRGWNPIQKAWLKRIFMLGFPIGLAIFFEVSLFSTAAIVVSPLGETMLAAHQIGISVTSQLFMIPMSLAIAVTIRTGMYYGEKNWTAMYNVQKMGFLSATLFALITMLLLGLLRPQILAIYTLDPAVIDVGMGLLLFALAYQLMDAWQITAAGCLRGMQDTRGPMWITLIAYWFIAFPCGVYLTRFRDDVGVYGVWVGLIVGLAVACVLLLTRLKQNNTRLANGNAKV